MDLVDGRNVGSLGPPRPPEIDGRALADQLFDAYLDQILVHGFVHADPHPGNVLLTADGRLALIDLGMVARGRSADLQDASSGCSSRAERGPRREVAAVMAGLGEKRDGWDPAGFERRIVALVQQHHDASRWASWRPA